MQASSTKQHKTQDQIDLERAAGEGMTSSHGEYTGAPQVGVATTGGRSLFAAGVELFKARPLETIGIAFGLGLVVGGSIAAIAKRR